MSRPASLVLALAALLLLPAGACAANPWLDQRVMNMAHQGGEDELPSNTMYAYKTSLARGADFLELDVGVTKDGKVVVIHDNTVDKKTNGTGSINDLTLAQVQRLDAAYWFVPGRNVVHGLPASQYPYRGIRTGRKAPPKGFSRDDFRIPTLDEVLRAFPRTPINVEIKGKDGQDEATYQRGARLLAQVLVRSKRKDVIVTSFDQPAIDTFHRLAPGVPLAPGIDGTANFLLKNGSPGPGVVAFQVPITFTLGGQKLTITTPGFVKKAHEAGYAVHVWLSDDTEDAATYRSLLSMCVDGIMAARPQALERLLDREGIGRPGGRGQDPCGTRTAAHATVSSSGTTATLTLKRRGLSMERRAGTLTLRGAGRHAATLGRARFTLASDATTTTATVRLTAAARRALAGGPLSVVAETREHGAPVLTRLTLRRR
jgi:glycerophosphoryl diester phosphodiesterase